MVDVRLPAIEVKNALDERRDWILDNTANMEKVAGEVISGDSTASFVAYYDQGELRYIRERLESGETGYGESFYFIDSDSLFGYEEESDWKLSLPDGETRDVAHEVSLYMDEYGTLTFQSFLKDGQRSAMPISRLEGIKSRYALLSERANQVWAGVAPDPQPEPEVEEVAEVAEEQPARVTKAPPADDSALASATFWLPTEYVGVSKSRRKGMNMGTLQVADSNVDRAVMDGVRARDVHLGQMVSLTAYWCAYRPDEFEMQWNYWGASRGTYLGQYIMSCGDAREIMDEVGEGERIAVPVHVRLKGVQDAAITLLNLNSASKISTIQGLESRFASRCLEHFCAGQSYVEKR
ncbi:hypothetical protein [Gallaecimonas sp. GXIMD4217]|uniref:hypothetical protein n=1 Tax=Gallaecimonas sp. GXIMD4217 TaxID=3131927 RepID=UPI00311B32C3